VTAAGRVETVRVGEASAYALRGEIVSGA